MAIGMMCKTREAALLYQARVISGVLNFIKLVCTKVQDNGAQRRVHRRASHRYAKGWGGFRLVTEF